MDNNDQQASPATYQSTPITSSSQDIPAQNQNSIDMQPNKKKRRIVLIILILLFTFIIPIIPAALFLPVYVFIAQPFQIAGDAMETNYVNGQYYLVNKLMYKLSTPNRGDVIVFRAPSTPDKDLISRIIGLPGETVFIQNDQVYVNNQPLDESSYLKWDVRTFGRAFLEDGQEITVPANHYFVLSDNRPNSSDSREWGFVPKEDIIGNFVFCFYNCKLSNR